jgi:hypothetical protein
LVAQFYEDTQQTALAKEHAHKSAQLAPEQFQYAAQQLEARLYASHWSCLSAFSSPSIAPGAVSAAP